MRGGRVSRVGSGFRLNSGRPPPGFPELTVSAGSLGCLGSISIGCNARFTEGQSLVSLRQGCAAGRTGNFSAGAGPAAGVSG